MTLLTTHRGTHRLSLRLLVLLSAAVSTCSIRANAASKLEIVNVQASYGLLGPERKSLEVYPLDEVFFRYQITGVTVVDGKTDVETVMHLINPNGKKVVDEKPKTPFALSLGGNTLPGYAMLNVPPAEKAPAGEYTLSIQVRDKLAKETASFERKFTIKPTTFQILAPHFSRDVDGKIPANVGGLVGESLHFRLKVVGFDKSKKKIQVKLTVHILGEDGKDVVEKPRTIKVELTSAEDVAMSHYVIFKHDLFLNRAGSFTLRLTAEDAAGDQKTVFETPLKVASP